MATVKKVKKAQNGNSTPMTKTKKDLSAGVIRNFSVDTSGYAGGKKDFPMTETRTSLRNKNPKIYKSTVKRSQVTNELNKNKNGGKLKSKTSKK